jgi:2,4-dienoyl-CoA reductase-like NADH-dependent reductase (Old Yellow Enzyme family)
MADLLFTPTQLGSLTIKNRLVRSATCEGMALADGSVTDDLVAFYRRLAEGGVGLIITGHTYVHPRGKVNPGMVGLHTDDLIPGHRSLTEAAHAAGGAVAIQLNHAGRQTSPARIGRQKPLAPSALGRPGAPFVPKEMTEEEIEEAIQAFADAGRRAVEAGYDAVQIHSAHGYLVSEFNSPYANRRTDRWGGSPENRRRFLLEVYRRVRQAVGPREPVFVKLNGTDFVEGGLTPEESAEIAEALEAEGIDAIEVSAGFAESGDLIMRKGIATEAQEAYLLPVARPIRQAVGRSPSWGAAARLEEPRAAEGDPSWRGQNPAARGGVPVMLVGGLRSRVVMERMLTEEGMTFLSLSRPFICQPDLANRLRAHEMDRVACVSCGRCARDDRGWLSCAAQEGADE